MSTLRNTLTAATLLLVSSLAALAMQQDAYREVGDGAKPGPPQPQPQVVRDFNVKPDPNGVNSATFSLGYQVTQDKQSQYRLALDAFRTAPDGQDKEAKKAELKKQLTEIFEADMKARKAQADEIETRLKKLQDQYKSREAAKERIIDLQIEVLEKDAAGLEFPNVPDAVGTKPFDLVSQNPLDEKLATKAVNRLRSTLSPPGKKNPNYEQTLGAVLKRELEAAKALEKQGLFVVSRDGEYYAYGVRFTESYSGVYLLNSVSGACLGKYVVEHAIAEIRFQEGGVGVRFPDGKFEIRIPIETIEKLGGSGSSGSGIPADPDFKPLGVLRQNNSQSLDREIQLGTFVVSSDGQFYASSRMIAPSGPTMLYLVDAVTGTKMAKKTVTNPISHLHFTELGVATAERGKTPELLIPFESAIAKTSNKATEDSTDPDLPFAVNSKSGEVVDYSKLRKEYLTAKRLVDQAKKELEDKLSEAKKSKPDISDGDLKSIEQTSESYRESIKSRLQEATTILETKLKLLALDVESARVSLSVSESEFEKSQAINETKKNAVNTIELRRMQSVMEKDKVNLMRAQTILDLFQSIKTDGEPKQPDVQSR